MKKLMAFSVLALVLGAQCVLADNSGSQSDRHAPSQSQIRPLPPKGGTIVQPGQNPVPNGQPFQATPNPCGPYQGADGFDNQAQPKGM